MTFEKYQEWVKGFIKYKNPGTIEGLVYVTLGLTGEAGEIANKVKKIIRDHDGRVPAQYVEDLRKEMGDVLWYLATMDMELSAAASEEPNLARIAQMNVDKLEKRKVQGTLKGDGDNR